MIDNAVKYMHTDYNNKVCQEYLKLIIEKYQNIDRIIPLNADFIKNAVVNHG